MELSTNGQAALALAAAGYHVFACGPRSKTPLPGTHGVKDATRDAAAIVALWTLHPEANIGLAGGNGLLIVDIDPRNGGDTTLATLEGVYGPLPRTFVVGTPTGGKHIYAAYSGDKLSRPKSWAGIDLQGPDKYVLAPPSTHPNGGQYQYEAASSVERFPQSWIDALEATKAAKPEHEAATALPENFGQRPGDLYNASTDWATILEPLGWKRVNKNDKKDDWTRPGKDSGISATTGHCENDLRGKLLYVFSSAPECSPFEADRTYSLFEAFALINHGGDLNSAASDLASQGYVPIDDAANSFSAISVSDGDEADSSHDGELDGITPMDPAAFDNPVGVYVLATDPLTEASKHGRLLDLLVKVGVYSCPLVYLNPFSQPQYPVLFVTLGGRTGRGRKSEAQSMGDAVMRLVDASFLENNYFYQLSSGEGLITSLQDDPEKPGADKRRVLEADELSAFFTRACADGSILSQVVRQGFERKTLERRVGAGYMRASHYSLGITGAITKRELVKVLPPIEVYNGFANRFLWCVSQRDKRLNVFRCTVAEKEARDKEMLHHATACAEAIKASYRWLNTIQTVAFEDVNLNGVALQLSQDGLDAMATYQDWLEEYLERSEFGDLLARGTNMVLRIALINAILHRSHSVSSRHVAAAIATWNYCRESAERIFVDFAKPDQSHPALVEWIRAKGGVVTYRDLKSAPPVYRPTAKRDAALADLIRRGIGRWGEPEASPRGGKAFQRFILNQ